MKKIITVDGNEACARGAYMLSEIAGIYPITPSSPMAEHIDEWANKGKVNIFNDRVKVIEMQSEAGASGLIHGALQEGVLATTFTASQGLLLMIPNMYKMAGEMLPCVMHVAARSLSTHALSILGDHQDIYATRQTGFCMLASSSVQDCAYLSLIAHLSAIDLSLPFMHFFDGFRTSHEINKIEVLEKSDIENLINKDALKNFRRRALSNGAKTRGTAESDDIYFQATEARNIFYDKAPSVVENYMMKINEIAGTNYMPFNYYGSKDAKKVIVAMGSVCETIKEVIDNESNIGLIEVHLYRPFSVDRLLKVLPDSVESIAVLDRTREFGTVGEPLYLDVVSALKCKNITIVGGRYGLSSKNTTPSQIKAVYDMLDNPKHNFTIGINDDITHLSLEEKQYSIKNSKEILIYGLGSDGMVSASKSLIKLIGDNTDDYVQGYFEYDSKKSGGVTLSHLRISDKKIRSTYYVECPDVLVISNDTYFDKFELVKNISKNSFVLINSGKTDSELNEIIPNALKELLLKNNSKVYVIDANNIARSVGLNGKISMIMEYAIICITKLMDKEFTYKYLKEYINNKFFKKGEDVINKNILALDSVEKNIREFNVIKTEEKDNIKSENLIIKMMRREGNNLPVSSFIKVPDGTFPGGTTRIEKRGISSLVPTYIKDNCIECGMCSYVCPHSVIRTFLLTEEEYQNSPDYVKVRCRKTKDNYYYIVGISISDCTGCGLCVQTCIGKEGVKALTFKDYPSMLKDNEQDVFNYLNENIKDKKVYNENTIKGISMVEPKFKYCGACAGCGETSYIKILTQIYKDSLVIANATGCSSIYGASAPNMPYTIPWASSLFEDNAEYGLGMLMGTNVIRNRIKNIMENNMDNSNSSLFKEWLENYDNYDKTLEIMNSLTDDIPEELKALKKYIPAKTYWCIGGDGWAYDIGFGGLDHVLCTNSNINILVLDTEMYSNTGGQVSKSSPRGSLASFATSGKKTSKKDLATMFMTYKNVYVATISLGANMMQTLRVLKEAGEYNGPSIVIAYAPCISHGNKGGMSNTLKEELLAVKSGYFPLFRRHPLNGFTLDVKNVDFDLYEEFLNSQTRYASLKKVNPKEAENLLLENKKDSIERFEYLKTLSNMD